MIKTVRRRICGATFKMETRLATIAANYAEQLAAYNAGREKLDTAIGKLQNRQAALERKKQKLNFPYWTEKLLRPVLDEIKPQLPGWACDDERLTPMGIGCRVSVFFCKRGLPKNADPWQEGKYIYIVFSPGELDNGELWYETGKKTDRFGLGTIGELNGFNQITKVLDSVEEAVNHLKNQSLKIKTNKNQ